MRATLARIAVLGGAGLLLVVVVLLALLPGPGEDRAGSAHSTEPDGWRALFLLCDDLGFPVEITDAAPGELTGPGTALVLTRVPEAPPGPPAAEGLPMRARDPAHYGRFLAEGGTLVFIGDMPAFLDELKTACALELAGVESEVRVRKELTLELGDGQSFALEPGAFVTFRGEGLIELAGSTLPASTDRGLDFVEGEPVVEFEGTEGAEPEHVTVAARLAVGQGMLVLVGLERGTFANAALERTPEAALLFVRLLEALGPKERILFDHYALGGFMPPSRLELLFSPALLPTSLHLLAWCALFLVAAAWVGPFARDPEPLIAVAPLQRARGQGGLLARAGRFDLLAALLRRGLLERWNARTGTRTRGVEADLARLACGDAAWLRRARELFLGPPPRDADELAGLARGLATLERALQPSTASSTAATRPRPPSPPEP